MAEWINVSPRQAIQLLRRSRPVYAVESPGGDWAAVEAIEDILEGGYHASAYRVRFASGRVRVTPGAALFRVRHDGL